MHFRKLLLFITILLTSTANTPTASDDEGEATNSPSENQIIINSEEKGRRKRFCPGCRMDISQHEFGHPHRDHQNLSTKM